MFRRLSDPLPLSEASLLLLRPAMNAPVINVGYLPVGPARAALVAFGEEYGGIGIALGIRSNESGQVAVLRNQESIDFDVPLVDALEPLLARAERMGFLFDENLLEATPGALGRTRAMAHWADLMGGLENLLPPPEFEDAPSAPDDDGPVGPLSPSQAIEEGQYPELLLDDVAPLVLDDGEDLGFEGIEDEDDFLLDDADLGVPDISEPAAPAPAAAAPERPDVVLTAALDPAEALIDEHDLTQPTAPIASARRVPAVEPPAPPPKAAAVDAPAAARVELAAPVRPQALLSKFRQEAPVVRRAAAPSAARSVVRSRPPRPVGGESEAGADRTAELARIPIVRVRRDRVPPRVSLLARLLSSF